MISEAIAGVFKGAVEPILNKWIPDAKDRLEAELLFFKQAQEINLAQIEVNKIEAASDSLFKGGWRPFIGWVCGGSLAYSLVGKSVLDWVMAVVSLYTDKPIPALPAVDTTIVFDLILALLGLGGLRTFEKYKGVTK